VRRRAQFPGVISGETAAYGVSGGPVPERSFCELRAAMATSQRPLRCTTQQRASGEAEQSGSLARRCGGFLARRTRRPPGNNARRASTVPCLPLRQSMHSAAGFSGSSKSASTPPIPSKCLNILKPSPQLAQTSRNRTRTTAISARHHAAHLSLAEHARSSHS